MLFFVVGDEFEVVVVFLSEAGGEEVGFGHHGESALVEDVFEMLELMDG